MNKDRNKAKQNLLFEIKSICKEIEKTQSFSGLTSLSSRINELHEKFIVLNYLEKEMIEVLPHENTRPKKPTDTKEKRTKVNSTISFPKIALSLNDKVAFQNQLFNRESDLFNQIIVELNQTTTYSEAEELLKPYYEKFNWEEKEGFVKRFMVLIENRFI